MCLLEIYLNSSVYCVFYETHVVVQSIIKSTVIQQAGTEPSAPIKMQPFFTKHETVSLCSIAKILFVSKRVCIHLNFDTFTATSLPLKCGAEKQKDPPPPEKEEKTGY